MAAVTGMTSRPTTTITRATGATGPAAGGERRLPAGSAALQPLGAGRRMMVRWNQASFMRVRKATSMA
jgi:hypothetical protein